MPSTDISPITREQQAFLKPYLPPNRLRVASTTATSSGRLGSTREDAVQERSRRPFVTLTYAASLDSMISLAPGVRTTLSGPESKSMTHYLRQYHDGILVGVNTAVADDPSLNCRYPGSTQQPRPIIIDPSWRWDASSAKVTGLFSAGQGQQPVVIGRGPQVAGATDHLRLPVPLTGGEVARMSWTAILDKLRAQGVESVMIEGGATIINDLLAHPELVDCVIVTIAPTFLGKGGVAVAPAPKRDHGGEAVSAVKLKDVVWQQFGQDMVLCARLEHHKGPCS